MYYPESDIDIDLALLDLAEEPYEDEDRYEQLYDYPDRLDYDYYDDEPEFYGYRQTTCSWCGDSVTYHENSDRPKYCNDCDEWLEMMKAYNSVWHPEVKAMGVRDDREFALDQPLQRSEERLLNRIENSKRTRMVPVGVANWLRSL